MTTTRDPAPSAGVSHVSRLRGALAAPVDIAGLVYFRVVFGALIFWEMWRFIDHGWIERYYTGKELYFK